MFFLVHIDRIALYLDVVLQPLAGHGGHQLEALGELELDADVLEELIVEGVGAVELEDLRIKDNSDNFNFSNGYVILAPNSRIPTTF